MPSSAPNLNDTVTELSTFALGRLADGGLGLRKFLIYSIFAVHHITMTGNTNSAGQLELRRIPKPYDTPAFDHSDSIPEEEFDDAAERNETQMFTPYTGDEEQAVIRKLDRCLVLFLACLYMISFLDRSSKRAKSNTSATNVFLLCLVS